MRQLFVVVPTLCAIATLTFSGGNSPADPIESIESIIPICRLYLDPHDHFTRVVSAPAEGARLRASASLANITINYTGFTSEAQTAFRAAADIWLTQVNSSVPIVVDAQFTDLGNAALLGQAGFRSLAANFTGAPLANVLYPGPIANRLSGIDGNGTTSEIVVLLNSAANWSYATNGVPVAGKVDLVSVVLHELGHGLGVAGSAAISSTTGLGSWGSAGRPYAYDVPVADSANTSILNGAVYPNGSTVLASLLRGTGVSGAGLFWNGPSGIAGNAGARPRLYAPATYLPGSSYSHLDDATYPPGNVNSLMTPSLGTAEVIHTPGGIVNGMLADMGWGIQCSFGLDYSLVPVGAAGGTLSVTLSTTAGCPWTASTASTFASITAGSSGNTSAVVRIAVTANAGASPRLATVQIADQTLTIAQAGTTPCAYVLNPTSGAIGGPGGAGTVDLQTVPECPWTATAIPAEATITSATSGVGSATIGYAVAVNTVPSPRAVTLTIAGQPFVIAQGPAPPTMTLDRTSMRFGAIESGAGFISHTSAQTARLTQAGSGTVSWTAASSAPWLAVNPASGSGPATLTITTQYAGMLAASQIATVTLTYTGAANASGTITVTLASIAPALSAAPFGAFDTPADGATGIFGSIPVTGWALDDIEVSRVRILRDPVAGEPAGALVYIGDATLVDGARPDVQAQFGTLPRSSRAGWGYLMLTNFLPSLGNGTFRLTAVADDNDGHATVLGTKVITCANAGAIAPFGAIDTPEQGSTVTGNLINFGWVLGPAPRRADPPGGGTVQIVVDGAFLSAVPGGWTSRPDLTALFPVAQYPGIATALGVAAIDTTALANGVHTLAWVVTDHLGAAAGIGSRYFTVSNDSCPTSSGTCTGVSAPPVTEVRGARSEAVSQLSYRRGYDASAPLRSVKPDGRGRFTIHSEEIDRLELQLGAGATGYLRVAGELAPLPIGSRIDPATGTFTWQPGVGFVGTYDLVLAGREVRIVLDPKGSNRGGPQVVIDSPSADSNAAGSFVVSGWAADLDSATDAGVDTVHVWAYPAAGGDPIFIGAASFGGTRPDVAAVYGDRFAKSGFGIGVKGLPPGTYNVAVFAYSTVAGGFVPARTVRVTVR